MTTIWKKTLSPTDVQEVDLPVGAEVLCAAEQWGHICIWFRCDPLAAVSARKFAICGTGRAAPDASQAKYLGTAMLQGGALVLHVFEQL